MVWVNLLVCLFVLFMLCCCVILVLFRWFNSVGISFICLILLWYLVYGCILFVCLLVCFWLRFVLVGCCLFVWFIVCICYLRVFLVFSNVFGWLGGVGIRCCGSFCFLIWIVCVFKFCFELACVVVGLVDCLYSYIIVLCFELMIWSCLLFNCFEWLGVYMCYCLWCLLCFVVGCCFCVLGCLFGLWFMLVGLRFCCLDFGLVCLICL